jgi:hypothetical protein
LISEGSRCCSRVAHHRRINSPLGDGHNIRVLWSSASFHTANNLCSSRARIAMELHTLGYHWRVTAPIRAPAVRKPQTHTTAFTRVAPEQKLDAAVECSWP